MSHRTLIAGGGIGGLAAALACSRSGCPVSLYERAPEFGELGAGLQLGPNAVRVLNDWGLAQALLEVASFPERLQVRSAESGQVLAALRLGAQALQRYGAAYATLHRADLHQLLLSAVKRQAEVQLHLNEAVERFTQTADSVHLWTSQGQAVAGDVLIGADGLWGGVREQLLDDGAPRVTGHLAFRALLDQSRLPAQLRSQQVSVWLGPKLHVVQYPVRRGECLNLVAIVQGNAPDDLHNWDHSSNGADLHAALSGSCSALQALMEAVPEWRLWVLCDRPPMRSPQEQAQGRVALLGDAAHPMRPYLAQGAGMAIEDAACLGELLAPATGDVPAVLQRYAALRWQRNARVQKRSIRNGRVFHADGMLRWGRDLSLRLLGERLLDQPWLYGS
ncbi:MAG: FAD-dependent monooxygenase [Burkholderiaceae bacterium]